MTEHWTSLLGTARPCACGRVHEVHTREVLIGPGLSAGVGGVLSRRAPGRRGAVVADPITWALVGEAVVRDAGPGWDLTPVILEPSPGAVRLEADEAALDALNRALPAEADFLLCVGSGTLNDLVKLAATERKVPSVCVATAPSMNGYPSAIAAISRGGVKRTAPCLPPVAVVGDTDILAAAPREMIQAGLGDLLSKSTSSADWLIAHLLLGEYYCERPVEVVTEAERECTRLAAAIGRGEPGAVEALMEGLLQSGISMAMAGSSSPASGGEHLISHYWDMTAHARGREPGLHGRQVALATVMAARVHQRLREITQQGGAAAGLSGAGASELGQLRRESLAHFTPLLGAEAAGEIAGMVSRKHAEGDALQARLGPLRDAPARFWGRLAPLLRPPEDLRAAYLAAGVPTEARQLGIPAAEVHDALLYARHIRDRYTVLDLAADLGVLEQLAVEISGTA